MDIIKELDSKLPHFEDGRINYTGAKEAAAVVCYIFCKGKMLIMKRSDKVQHYKNLWNTAAGYYDELKTPYDIALKELKEEIGVVEGDIFEISDVNYYKFVDESLGLTWHKFLFKVELKEIPEIELDWEHSDLKWIDPKDIGDYDTVPMFQDGLKRILR